MKLLEHFAGEKSRLHLSRQEFRQILGSGDKTAGRRKPLPVRSFFLTSWDTAAVAGRQAELVVILDRGSLQAQWLAQHLLQKLVERFAGGTFQQMPQQSKSEV